MNMRKTEAIVLFWFRRDLRLSDNAGLYHALQSGLPVLPVFIFDTDILDDLTDKRDKRVDFIHRSLTGLQAELVNMNTTLHAFKGRPINCFRQLTDIYTVQAVYTNHDYEPYANRRDDEIGNFLSAKGITLHTFKDQVIFEKDEVIKDNESPYTVYTPFSKKWKEKLNDFYLASYPTEKYFHRFYRTGEIAIPSLAQLGFEETDIDMPPAALHELSAQNYDATRDYPALKGTTRMGVHLRFGTVSIRMLAAAALRLNVVLLNELIWREFYMMILWHFPYVVGGSFKKEYDNIQWRRDEREFELWCTGQTGVPMVDAGMRELNATGYMHNRVRMITASFLTKNLLIDWRWGEAYFAQKLLDYDLAANNGGWQWAAGCGCDAAPYFRIFNPQLQAEKFDPQREYIRKWVPEIESLRYATPIVDFKASRERCLREYKRALGREDQA